jgi:hypothetical protein
MTMATAPMTFPALFEAVDGISASSQTRFLLARGSELMLIVAAASLGEIPRNSIGGAGPWSAVVLFACALAIRLSGAGDRAEKRWYDGRTAAESIKTATWEYAVGGESYRLSTDSADHDFRTFLQNVLTVLPNLVMPAGSKDGLAITGDMAELRGSNLDRRIDSYREQRIRDQQKWYSAKSDANRNWAQRWLWFLIAVQVAAVVLGLLHALGAYDVNWLGMLAAGAAGIAAWQQAKDHSNLAEAYAVTSQEIGILVHDIEDVGDSEDKWAQFVHDSEAAFSRENTLWLARRQGPLK